MVFYPYFGSSHICPQLERFSTYSNQFGSHISLDNWPRLSYQYSQNGNYTLCWHRCSFFHLYTWQTNESQLRLNCSTRVKIRWKRQPLRDKIFNVKRRLTVSVFLKCNHQWTTDYIWFHFRDKLASSIWRQLTTKSQPTEHCGQLIALWIYILIPKLASFAAWGCCSSGSGDSRRDCCSTVRPAAWRKRHIIYGNISLVTGATHAFNDHLIVYGTV